jgi:hypothetical protein
VEVSKRMYLQAQSHVVRRSVSEVHSLLVLERALFFLGGGGGGVLVRRVFYFPGEVFVAGVFFVNYFFCFNCVCGGGVGGFFFLLFIRVGGRKV